MIAKEEVEGLNVKSTPFNKVIHCPLTRSNAMAIKLSKERSKDDNNIALHFMDD